jgi:hypothetical protein
VFPLVLKSSDDVTQPKERKGDNSYTVNSVEEKYRILFYEMIDNQLNNMSACFSSIEKNGFL